MSKFISVHVSGEVGESRGQAARSNGSNGQWAWLSQIDPYHEVAEEIVRGQVTGMRLLRTALAESTRRGQGTGCERHSV